MYLKMFRTILCMHLIITFNISFNCSIGHVLIEWDLKIAQAGKFISYCSLEILRLKNCSHHLPRSIYQRKRG